MNQSELAEKINTTQLLLSMLERGIGGNFKVAFDFVNYLYSKSIDAKEIFSEHFSLDLVTKNSNDPATINTQIEELVKELQRTMNGDMDKLLLLNGRAPKKCPSNCLTAAN
ncbi:MAG: hypothetical protein ABIR03_02740 [Ginsengibacter sp.]